MSNTVLLSFFFFFTLKAAYLKEKKTNPVKVERLKENKVPSSMEEAVLRLN